ncbi:VOC family protein [Sanguibacter gelidistatuariae]|nr:glyoxalase [Sanguibacter gelidistatuariae]
MTTHPMIFVNLPIADVAASRSFWSTLGYSFNEQFSDENALCLVFSDSIFAMLLQRDFFQSFTDKPVVDARTSAQVLNGLAMTSRAEVDALVDAAVAAGATEPRPAQDQGFMYERGFSDLDGHDWEIMWMDPSAVEPT